MSISRSVLGKRLAIMGFSMGTLVSSAFNFISAAPRELIRNGGFETGELSNWSTVLSDGGLVGSFVKLAVAGNTPRGGRPTAANPTGGTSFAVSDQNNVSYQILFQKFRIPRGTRRVIMTYQMFVRSDAAVVFNPTVFSTSAGPNQQARVDLLKATASNLSTTTGVVAQLYRNGADAVLPLAALPYIRYRFDLSRKVTPGRSYKIRFGTAASGGSINLGVDNVSVKAY